MRVRWLVLGLALVVSGCSAPSASTTSTQLPGATDGPTQHDGAPKAQHVHADLAYKALFASCAGPLSVLAWEFLEVHPKTAVAGDLNISWDPQTPAVNLVVGFTTSPAGTPLASAEGGSPLRWVSGPKTADRIHPATRLEPLGPQCSEGLPAHVDVDTVVHIDGTIWMT